MKRDDIEKCKCHKYFNETAVKNVKEKGLQLILLLTKYIRST